MPMTTSHPRKANSHIVDLCTAKGEEHDVRVTALKCGRCGADLCDICMSDEHFVSDGHDLSNPAYWGV